MKVAPSKGKPDIVNRKKNALPRPTSKLLKPKKFKPLKVSNKDKKKCAIGKNNRKLAIESILCNPTQVKPKNKNLHEATKKTVKKPKGIKVIKAPSDVVKSGKVLNTSVKKPTSENDSRKDLSESSNKKSRKRNRSRSKRKLLRKKKFEENKKSKQEPGKLSTTQNKLGFKKVSPAVASLFKLAKEKSKDVSSLLDLAEPIFLQVECIKIPICPTKQLRFKPPHPLTNELSDVLLITGDKKGSKIYPEKAIEHYTELLAKHNVSFIQKVIPLRILRQEYSQYEMRRKLVDQFDVILADAKIIKCLPKALGKFICYNRKMPVPVQLNRSNLKEILLSAISNTQMTVKANGAFSTIQVGHMKMSELEVVENIVETAKWLAEQFPGGWRNIRSLGIKTSNSVLLTVYLSLLSPNMVKIPVEKPKKRAPVEGELSTVLGANVIVKADGTVILKQLPEGEMLDNSKDEEILEEAKKYAQSSKTVRYDDSDDDGKDNEKEADAITASVEQELLDNYGISKKSKDEDDEDEEEEEEESSDEEDLPVAPSAGKKRKLEPAKNQSPGKPASKKQQKGGQQEKPKGSKSTQKGKTPFGEEKTGLQKRGSRGGKKNKMSKDQRKALIKRKKAGKK